MRRRRSRASVKSWQLKAARQWSDGPLFLLLLSGLVRRLRRASLRVGEEDLLRQPDLVGEPLLADEGREGRGLASPTEPGRGEPRALLRVVHHLENARHLILTLRRERADLAHLRDDAPPVVEAVELDDEINRGGHLRAQSAERHLDAGHEHHRLEGGWGGGRRGWGAGLHPTGGAPRSWPV